MHSMPVDVLASLPEFGLPRLVPHLGAFSLAERLGMMRRLMYLRRVLQLVDDRIDDEDEATLLGVNVWAGWRVRSLSVQLTCLWRDTNQVGLRHPLAGSAWAHSAWHAERAWWSTLRRRPA